MSFIVVCCLLFVVCCVLIALSTCTHVNAINSDEFVCEVPATSSLSVIFLSSPLFIKNKNKNKEEQHFLLEI